MGYIASPSWGDPTLSAAKIDEMGRQLALKLPLSSMDTGPAAHMLPVSGTVAAWKWISRWNDLQQF